MRIIERENGEPIKWRCHHFTIEKYFIENINRYAYGVSSFNENECYHYFSDLKQAEKWCKTNDVKEVERIWKSRKQ